MAVPAVVNPPVMSIDSPGHTFVEASMYATNASGCVIVTLAVAEHSFASFTVTVYVPGARLFAVLPVRSSSSLQAYV